MTESGPKGNDFIGSGDKRLNINIEEPRWDQSNYIGRVKHFFVLTDVRNIFASSKQLEDAKKLVQDYRSGVPLDHTTVDELWKGKYLHDSAFHPDTGEKLMVLGRMSACLPVNTALAGALLTFRKKAAAVFFWQWMNQTVSAVINFSNRSGKQDIPVQILGLSYLCATTGAVATALGVNSLVKKMPPIVGRFVPYIAVCAANAINIPVIRSQELIGGTEIFDQNENSVGKSKIAAIRGITSVFISRVSMMAPGMMLPPIVCDVLEKRGTLCRYPWIELPVQMVLLVFTLFFANPMCCAFFPQKMPIKVSSLEQDVQDSLKKLKDPPTIVTFNKGL